MKADGLTWSPSVLRTSGLTGSVAVTLSRWYPASIVVWLRGGCRLLVSVALLWCRLRSVSSVSALWSAALSEQRASWKNGYRFTDIDSGEGILEAPGHSSAEAGRSLVDHSLVGVRSLGVEGRHSWAAEEDSRRRHAAAHPDTTDLGRKT